MSTLSFGFKSSELGQSGSCKVRQWATRLSIFNPMVNVKYYRGLTSFCLFFNTTPRPKVKKCSQFQAFTNLHLKKVAQCFAEEYFQEGSTVIKDRLRRDCYELLRVKGRMHKAGIRRVTSEVDSILSKVALCQFARMIKSLRPWVVAIPLAKFRSWVIRPAMLVRFQTSKHYKI